jgi:hypothetical protein
MDLQLRVKEVLIIAKLLFEESPLLILPTLAKTIGLNQAIVLQQIHYWLEKSSHVIDGKKWIYNSFPDWQKQFPFWTERTIRRIMKSLSDQGLIRVENFNKLRSDKTNWYTINYENIISISTDCPYHRDKLSSSIPETTTDKYKYASSVSLSETQYAALMERYGEEKVVEMIELLNNYKEAHGKKYKSDYHAILQWVAKEVTGNKKNAQPREKLEKEIEYRQQEVAFNRWIEEGKNPDDFTY